MTGSANRNWWLTLVTFERRDEHQTEFLPDDCQGASGWMACLTSDAEGIRDMVEAALIEAGLRLVGMGDAEPVEEFEDVETWDSHLAANIAALEPGKSVVWGTIHTYVGDSEA
jgi:hypothetical protein